jgi:dCMP deaminase
VYVVRHLSREDRVMKEKWDRRFLEMAELVGSWSKDPSTQVGAVIVDKDRRIVSTGYNGFPKGIADRHDLLHDREKKYKLIIHGEMNAILFAGRSLEGCTLYTTPFLPCATCSSFIIQSGITRVVSWHTDHPRWSDSIQLAKSMFAEAGVECIEYLRDL